MKRKKAGAAQMVVEINPRLQKQGMSSAWQLFYAKVKQAVEEKNHGGYSELPGMRE